MTKTTKILIIIGIAIVWFVFIGMPGAWAIPKDRTNSTYIVISFPASIACAFAIKVVWGYKPKGTDEPE